MKVRSVNDPSQITSLSRDFNSQEGPSYMHDMSAGKKGQRHIKDPKSSIFTKRSAPVPLAKENHEKWPPEVI